MRNFVVKIFGDYFTFFVFGRPFYNFQENFDYLIK